MTTNQTESSMIFFKEGGHNHDGENSTKIDFSKYSDSDLAVLLDRIGGGSDDTPTSTPTTPASTSLSKVSMGPITLGVYSFSDDYHWHIIPDVFTFGLIWRFSLTTSATVNWGVKVTSQEGGEGETMFEAVGIGQVDYQCSWPWVFENQNGDTSLYLGVRNISGSSSTFTLSSLRGVQF